MRKISLMMVTFNIKVVCFRWAYWKWTIHDKFELEATQKKNYPGVLLISMLQWLTFFTKQKPPCFKICKSSLVSLKTFRFFWFFLSYPNIWIHSESHHFDLYCVFDIFFPPLFILLIPLIPGLKILKD